MMDAMQYNITVRKGMFDGETCFEARVAELPDVAEYGDTYEEAYELALDSIETTAAIFAEKGKQMPAPIVSAEDFSGRVTLRLAKTLHRSLASVADQEGVSLNQHMVNVLSYYSGYCQGQVSTQQTKGYWATSAHYKAPTKSGARPKLRVVSTSSPQQQVGYS
ncbi:toxin-antitoxin system HicB family antitoxin [Salinimonas sp. HHU 13199]|uniref:Toxin-antitoxin system HicB family antitoxin n=1 Tax=Salinimonas profundi TaxID=2729140 RepID=A0ABR8LTD4_9ALTE|nr:toxin-antitoxin system HicB family antitoxin [Salinimonas profundi]MBD3587435.1 toxin-antitoxin system HicB family antitoxin [Salinimonas profundi]